MLDTEPVPAVFSALTLNWYSCPFVRPVTVADVAVDVPSANALQLVPPSERYSI